MQFTPVRVVCQNTISLALETEGSTGRFRMPHIRQFDQNMHEAAAEAIGISSEIIKKYHEKALVLSEAPVLRPNDLNAFIARLFDPKALADKKGEITDVDLETTKRITRKVFELISTQPGHDLVSSEGTWWGAFNAVTRFVDHDWGHNRDAALHNAWFGPRAGLKNKALELALEYAKS